MFAGFNLDISSSEALELNKYKDAGTNIFNDQKVKIQNSLSPYLAPDGSLSASKIEENWFPTIDAEVFLSHSHQDEDLVIAFSGYLKNQFGINCFIDSCVWGYANDLLKQIDEKYCRNAKSTNGSYTYNYEKRNQSTSHVHMLLNGALAKMIDATESLIFINTPNSIEPSDVKDGAKTASPWIYSELLMATIFPHRQLKYYRDHFQHSDGSHFEFSEKQLQIKYDVSIDKLYKLTMSDFKSIKKSFWPYTALDQLYFNKNLVSGMN